MRSAQIENGVVINFAEVAGFVGEFIDPLDAQLGAAWDGSNFKNPPLPEPVVPQTVSPRQIRMALSRTPYHGTTLRAAVEAAVDASDQDTQDWYERATIFERQLPVVLAMGVALGVTSEELDRLWILADTL